MKMANSEPSAVPEAIAPIGRCIYCGSTEDLSDEHILPYSMWGTDVLPKASCPECAKITGRFEQHVARDLYLAVRMVSGAPTRRKKTMPTSFPLEVIDADGKPQTLQLPANEHPALVIFPEYQPPTMFVDGTTRVGIAITGNRLIGFGKDLLTVQKEHQFKELQITSTFKVPRFEQFLAKWAYCTAIKHYGLDNLETVYVIDDIIRNANTIGSYVGTDGQVVIGKQAAIASYQMFEDDQRRVVVRLKLFANSDAPEYIVLVGVRREPES